MNTVSFLCECSFLVPFCIQYTSHDNKDIKNISPVYVTKWRCRVFIFFCNLISQRSTCYEVERMVLGCCDIGCMITIEWSPIFTVDVFKLIIWLSRFLYGTSKQFLYLKLYSDQCFTTTDEKTIFSKSDSS